MGFFIRMDRRIPTLCASEVTLACRSEAEETSAVLLLVVATKVAAAAVAHDPQRITRTVRTNNAFRL